MRNFIVGILVGGTLTASLGMASQFYDSKGHPNAPSGSVQQFDYFRQRQQFLDLNAMRRNADEDRLNSLKYPCGR